VTIELKKPVTKKKLKNLTKYSGGRNERKKHFGDRLLRWRHSGVRAECLRRCRGAHLRVGVDLFVEEAAKLYDSLDGQRFLVVKQGTSSTAPPQIVLVQNWLEELRKLLPWG
jgi:hypothetical protein